VLSLVVATLVALPAASEVNRIVIRVNDHIATLYDYELARAQLVDTLQRSNLPPEELQERLADVGVQVMSDLFEEALLLSRAEQIDAVATREEVEEAMKRAKEGAGIESEEEFEQGLAASGFTRETFREHLKKNLTMNTVMGREVRPRVDLNEEDLRRYYQTHLEEFQVPRRLKVREFVVLESATTHEEDRQAIAGEIRDALLSGEGGDELVADYAEKGLTTPWIDIGWVESGDLDPQLEEAIWDLASGEVSAPVPARGGLHVCQVEERQEATVQEFADVRGRIEEQEANRRFSEEIGEYLADLERASYVIYNPPPEAASFRSVLQRRRDEGLEFDEREVALSGGGTADETEESGGADADEGSGGR
jgi:parvulin-like peptidyl-prolyl isomerase